LLKNNHRLETSMNQLRERKWTFLALSGNVLAVVLNMEAGLQAEDEIAVPSAKTVFPSAVSRTDRSQFIGARTCIDCHRSEYVSWLNMAHSNNRTNRFEGTDSGIDTKYQKLNGNTDLCYTCHTLPEDERFGRKQVETGVSCESCHGAAGGEDGWLNRHAVYGPNVTQLDQETPEHFKERIAYCENAGMIRPERQFDVAKNCLSCHIPADARLFEAGHKVSFAKFSLVPYMLGEVRHNFHLDQRTNAKTPSLDTKRRNCSPVKRVRLYFIIEQLARMEVALNSLAGLPSEEALEDRLADELIGIFDDAAGELEEFTEVLMEEPDAEGELVTEEEAAPLLAAIEEFGTFEKLDPLTRADAAAAAARISALANEFLSRHDGGRLGVLDVEFLEDLGDQVGKALEP
jgi:hypothetical protein